VTSNPTIKWVVLALVGLLIAAAVAVLGSSLASRQIGLSSEPLRAGDALAPPPVTATAKPAKPQEPKAPAEPTEPSEPSEPPPPPEATEPPVIGSEGESGDD
jgi:hypothetical protein